MLGLTRSFGSIIFALLGVILSGNALAGAQQFGASVTEARWTAAGDRLHCRLSHNVPYYGEAVFSRRAGGSLQFTLNVIQPPRGETQAMLASVPPDWKHGAARKDLGPVPVRAGAVPITLGESEARRLLAELYQGMFPTLVHKDWADGADDVYVWLSAVNFRSALGEFVECSDTLLSYDFDAVKNSVVRFEFDRATLTRDARLRLEQVAQYVVADQAVDIVLVDGHTDNRGTRAYNDALARRRAESVRDFFLAQGVAADKLSVRYHGERRPAVSNRTEQGRAVNRRVIVQLAR